MFVCFFRFSHRVRRCPQARATAAALLCLALAGCASAPALPQRRATADSLAAARGWHTLELAQQPFPLLAALPRTVSASEVLTVYIEGDGLAWTSRNTPSDDPTPLEPLALQLALAQPHGAAAWLARPCQYLHPASCRNDRWWTEARFAPEAVQAIDQAISTLKARTGARRLVLVGYSGGGAMAALLAAQRNDVAALLTVAGNLDHQAWSRWHRTTPLAGSLNAMDAAPRLQQTPQWHFAGERDRNISPALLQAAAARLAPAGHVRVQVEPDFDHRCCWAQRWPQLWQGSVGTLFPAR